MSWKPFPQQRARILREAEEQSRMASTVENILEDILATLEHPENQALVRPHLPLLLDNVKHWRNRLDEVHDELWPELAVQQSGEKQS